MGHIAGHLGRHVELCTTRSTQVHGKEILAGDNKVTRLKATLIGIEQDTRPLSRRIFTEEVSDFLLHLLGHNEFIGR